MSNAAAVVGVGVGVGVFYCSSPSRAIKRKCVLVGGGDFFNERKRERERERERVVFFGSKVPHFFLLFNFFYKP